MTKKRITIIIVCIVSCLIVISFSFAKTNSNNEEKSNIIEEKDISTTEIEEKIKHYEKLEKLTVEEKKERVKKLQKERNKVGKKYDDMIVETDEDYKRCKALEQEFIELDSEIYFLEKEIKKEVDYEKFVREEAEKEIMIMSDILYRERDFFVTDEKEKEVVEEKIKALEKTRKEFNENKIKPDKVKEEIDKIKKIK